MARAPEGLLPASTASPGLFFMTARLIGGLQRRLQNPFTTNRTWRPKEAPRPTGAVPLPRQSQDSRSLKAQTPPAPTEEALDREGGKQGFLKGSPKVESTGTKQTFDDSDDEEDEKPAKKAKALAGDQRAILGVCGTYRLQSISRIGGQY